MAVLGGYFDRGADLKRVHRSGEGIRCRVLVENHPRIVPDEPRGPALEPRGPPPTQGAYREAHSASVAHQPCTRSGSGDLQPRGTAGRFAELLPRPGAAISREPRGEPARFHCVTFFPIAVSVAPKAAIVLAHGQRPDATGAAVVIQGIAFTGAPNSGAAAASLPHNFAFRRLEETSPIDGIGIRRFGRLAPLVNSDSLLPAQGHLGITPPASTAH